MQYGPSSEALTSFDNLTFIWMWNALNRLTFFNIQPPASGIVLSGCENLEKKNGVLVEVSH